VEGELEGGLLVEVGTAFLELAPLGVAPLGVVQVVVVLEVQEVELHLVVVELHLLVVELLLAVGHRQLVERLLQQVLLDPDLGPVGQVVVELHLAPCELSAVLISCVIFLCFRAVTKATTTQAINKYVKTRIFCLSARSARN